MMRRKRTKMTWLRVLEPMQADVDRLVSWEVQQFFEKNVFVFVSITDACTATAAPAWVTLRGGDGAAPAAALEATSASPPMLWPFLRKARLDLGKKFGKDRTNELAK